MNYPLPKPGFKLLTAEAAPEQLVQLIGLDFDIFVNTVLFVQATSGSTATNFIDCDDGDQKDRFRKLFNLQRFEEAGELVFPDLRSKRQHWEELSRNMLVLEANIVGKTELVTQLKSTKELFELTQQNTRLELLSALARQRAALAEKNQDAYIAAIKAAEQAVTDQVDRVYGYEKKIRELHVQVVGHNQARKSFDQEIAGWPPLLEPIIPIDPGTPLEDLMASKHSLEEESVILSEHRVQCQQAIATRRTDLTLAAERCRSKDSALRAMQARNAELLARRAKLADQIQALEIGEAPHCPTCRQVLPKEQQEATILGLKAQLAELFPMEEAPLQLELEAANAALFALSQSPPELETLTEIEAALLVRKKDLAGISAQITQAQLFVTQTAVYESKRVAAQQEASRRDARRFAIDVERGRIAVLLSDLQTQLDALDTERRQAEGILTKFQMDLATVNARFTTEVGPILLELDTLKGKLDLLDKSEFPQQKVLADALAALAEAQRHHEEAKLRVAELLIQVETLDQLNTAFGNEGIVSELFREYIPEIQRRSNAYLTALTGNELEIEFRSERQLKKKAASGEAATRAQFSIIVRKKTGVEGYDLISGSDQKKAALVCNLALADLAADYAGVKANLRVFDEIFDSLDAKGMERLVGMLHSFHNQIVFVITHKVELEDSFPRKILLRKENGATTRVQ